MPSLCRVTLGLLLGAALAGCAGGGSGSSTEVLGGSRGESPLAMPTDTRRARREGFRANTPKPKSEAAQAAEIETARAQAERLWQQAERLEPRNPEDAGDVYQEIADNYGVSLRAAEAKFRQGRAYARAGESISAFEAFRRYMEIAPSNPHMAEIEETVLKLGKRWLASIHGLAGLFKDEEQGYAMLQWVADTFPNGTYADDALFTLAEALRRDGTNEALVQSVQHYRALLMRYPRCDVAAEAHLGLAATYEARDQGAAWHGGYVDVDPREPMPEDPAQLANAGPVMSALEMAAFEYQGVFELLEHCPSLVSDSQRSRAAVGLKRAQERLAAKDERIAGSYGGRSAARAQPYYRAAQSRRGAAARGELWVESEEVERIQKERRRLEAQAAPVQPMPGQPVPAQPPGVPPPSAPPPSAPQPIPGSSTTPPPTPTPTPTPAPAPTPTPAPAPDPGSPASQRPVTPPPSSVLPPPVVRKVSSR